MRNAMMWSLAPWLGGCFGGTSFSGEIDGDAPKLRNAYFIQEDNYYEGGDSQIAIIVSDLDDPCVVDELLQADLEDAGNDAGDLEEAWESNVPEDFWEFLLVVRVGDADDDLSKSVLEGVAWDEVTEKDEQVYGIITHYVDHLDEEYWLGYFNDLDDYGKFWYSDGGDLEIDKHKPGEMIKGRFISEAADPNDGDNEGDFTVDFKAERCKPMERYYFD